MPLILLLVYWPDDVCYGCAACLGVLTTLAARVQQGHNDTAAMFRQASRQEQWSRTDNGDLESSAMLCSCGRVSTVHITMPIQLIDGPERLEDVILLAGAGAGAHFV